MKTITHRPFIYIAGAYSLGIILGLSVRFPLSYSCLLIFALLALGAGLSRKAYLSTVFLLLAVAGLGAVRVQARGYIPKEDIEHVARYYRKKPAAIEGIIASDIQERTSGNAAKTTFTLDVTRVRAAWGWQRQTGKILVNMFCAADLVYGDHVFLEGKLHRPYNFSSGRNFSYRDYLARQDIRLILSVKKDAPVRLLGRGKGNYAKALSLKLRDRFADILSGNLSKNEAGIMKAILLGDRSGISKPIRTLFVQTGTAHILAISGLHMGIVAALFFLVAKTIPVGRRWQSTAVIFLVAGYAFLTGARPSVVRAAVMTVIFLASFILEREFDRLNTLCLAGTAILLFNPFNLFDAGFQLSFSCVLAIIYADARMNKEGFKRQREKAGEPQSRHLTGWAHYVFQSLYLSLVIWLAVAGLIAYYFGMITPVTILANVIVIPLISIIVALGFGLLLTGVAVPAWAFLFALCLKVALNVMIGLIFLCDRVPFAHIYIREATLWHIAAYYSAVLLAILIPWRRLKGGIRRNLSMGQD